MAGKKNLCAMLPEELHARVRQEQERLGLTLSEYVEQVLREYYAKGEKPNMENTRTVAFQIPEELFQRIKRHLERETARTGRKVTQREFVLGLIEEALCKAEQEIPETADDDAPEEAGPIESEYA